MSKFRTNITIGEYETDIIVKYNFYPGERMIPYFSDSSGYPGTQDHVEIENVYDIFTGEPIDINYDLTEELIEKALINHNSLL